jgi:hypothetical protein
VRVYIKKILPGDITSFYPRYVLKVGMHAGRCGGPNLKLSDSGTAWPSSSHCRAKAKYGVKDNCLFEAMPLDITVFVKMINNCAQE